jgi:hypothetical protein
MSRLRLLVDSFRLSVSDLANASGRRISRSQVHRILAGQHRPSPEERQALAIGVVACIQSRCDSAFLFDEEAR